MGVDFGLSGIATAVSLAATAASTVHNVKVSKNNKDAEEKAAKLRAEERTRELRRTLAAQRMGLLSQGRNPDYGSSLVLQSEAYDAAERDARVDEWQTDVAKQNWDNQATSSVLSGVAGMANTAGSYYATTKEGTLGSPVKKKPVVRAPEGGL